MSDPLSNYPREHLSIEKLRLIEAAKAYKLSQDAVRVILIGLVLVVIAVIIIRTNADLASAIRPIGVVINLVFFIVAIRLAISYAKVVDSSPVSYVVLTLFLSWCVPFGVLIMVLVLQSKLAAIFREADIQVTKSGVNAGQLDEYLKSVR